MIEPAVPANPDATRWRRALAAAHGWRGEMIDLFARAEAEINETLLAIGCASNEPMVGARKARLAKAVAVGGPHAVSGMHVRRELDRFSEHDSWRCALCHGQGQVLLDQQNRWVLVLRIGRLQGEGIERSVAAVDEVEAGTLHATLRDQVARLGGQLRHLRQQVAMRKSNASLALGEPTGALLQPVP